MTREDPAMRSPAVTLFDMLFRGVARDQTERAGRSTLLRAPFSDHKSDLVDTVVEEIDGVPAVTYCFGLDGVSVAEAHLDFPQAALLNVLRLKKGVRLFPAPVAEVGFAEGHREVFVELRRGASIRAQRLFTNATAFDCVTARSGTPSIFGDVTSGGGPTIRATRWRCHSQRSRMSSIRRLRRSTSRAR